MKKRILNLIFRFINLISNKVNLEIEKTFIINDLIKQNLSSRESIINNENNRITISLTTFGKRIDDVYLTLESIARQTLKPNRVLLWLSKDEYSPENLPITLANLKRRGLEIKYCSDLKSYKKIIPTIKECPDDVIITIDDDIIYNFDLIEVLYKNYLIEPNTIYCGRAKVMEIKNKKQFNYNSWKYVEENSIASLLHMPIGFSGVLYFPGCFSEDVLNEDIFMKLAPSADDVWLKSMTLMNGVPVKQISNGFAKSSKLIPLEKAQKDSLSIANVIMGDNNTQLSKVFNKYNIYYVFEK